jgi:hypothetical protein
LPITSGTPFPAGTTDLQAWIRNANLAPDWLRIGADIIGGTNTFNMTFSLSGYTIPEAGTPGLANCHHLAILTKKCRLREQGGGWLSYNERAAS